MGILAFDAGQTGVRAVRAGGAPGPQAPGVPRMEGGVGPGDVVAALVGALDGPALAGVEAIGVGLSGFELAGEDELARIAAGLRAATGAADGVPVAVASDGVTSLLGALGRRPGVVVAAGTGVVVVGYDGARGWARVDGWGSLLGDDGSGFAIGCAGLRSALRAHDGREGGSEALRAAAEARFGSLDELGVAILRDGAPATRVVASFAPAVASAAGDADGVAAAIFAGAGDELAASAAAAAGRVFAAEAEVPIAPLGNLWRAGELLAAPFCRGLERRRPGTRIVQPAGTSLDGALALARPDGPPPVRGLLWRG